MKLLILLLAITVFWNIRIIRTEYTNGIVSFLIAPTDPIETGRVKRDAAIPGNIEQLNITTNVSNRFAKTTMSARVKNDQVSFAVVLPVNAFISRFWMEIENITYEGKIKENKYARRIYNEAVLAGRPAGHIELNVRDSKRFMVSVNVQPKKTVFFHVTYEELLTRKNNRYEVVTNIYPTSFVNELKIVVSINETMPLLFIGTPHLEIKRDLAQFFKNHDEPKIDVINANSAEVTFTADISKLSQIQSLNSNNHRMGAEFTVQYDLIRNIQSDPVLIGNNHFIHFFAPTVASPLPKHMIFVLDMSSSMVGAKLAHLKEGMRNLLKKLKPHDVFNILEFSDTFTMWDIPANNKVTFEAGVYGNDLESHYVPPDVEATDENIQKAMNMMNHMQGDGLTNLFGALQDAIYLSKRNMKNENNYFQSMIMLVTDGEPNVGLTVTNDIVDRVLALNTGVNRAAIFCLSIGENVPQELPERISLTNNGVYRRIYDGEDSAVQMQDFFREIASPMLKGLRFAYGDGAVKIVTKTAFPLYFSGAEIIIAGVIDEKQKENFNPIVRAHGKSDAPLEFHPGNRTVAADFERLLAYLTVKQGIDLMKVAPNASAIADKILGISLQYSIFTPLTSMSIVKPDGHKRRIGLENAWVGREEVSLQPSSIHYGDRMVLSYDEPSKQDHDSIYSYGTFMNHPTANPPANGDLTTTTTEPTTSDMLNKLKVDLPWISRMIVDGDTIQVGEDTYRLDLENPVKWEMLCMNTANTTAISGRCRSLSDCEEIKTIASNSHKFLQHFCPLNNIAGICCSR